MCASDGNTFENLCELQKENCVHNKSLVSVYFGPCHDKSNSFALDVESEPMDVESDLRANLLKESKLSCDNLKCKFGGQCAYNQFGKPYCECDFGCEHASVNPNQQKFVLLSLLPEKVCGSNGIIYASECELKSEACTNQLDIQMVKFNHCENQIQSLVKGKTIANVPPNCLDNNLNMSIQKVSLDVCVQTGLFLYSYLSNVNHKMVLNYYVKQVKPLILDFAHKNELSH